MLQPRELQEHKITKYKHLLAIPGGGVRGIVSSVYISRLVKSGTLKLDDIYSFSGTSTGSIIAAALAANFSPDKIIELYHELAKEVFKPRCFLPRWLATTILGAPFSSDRLVGVLKNVFGPNRRLGDIKRNLVIVAWNLSGKYINRAAASPLVFTTLKTGVPADEELLSQPLYNVVAASCSAPAYFAPLLLKTPTRKILTADGGVVSNLSVCANIMTATSSHYNGIKIPIEQMTALVLGNGTRIAFDKAEPQGGWATPAMISRLIGSIGGANQVFSHELASALLNSRYLNFDPVPDFDAQMDDVSQMKRLHAWASGVDLGQVSQWLGDHFV